MIAERIGSSRRRMTPYETVRRILFKFGALCLALLSICYVSYFLIGLFARLGSGLKSVHMTYPVEPRFRDAYAFKSGFMRPIYRTLNWMPTPIGIFSQGGAYGLALAIASDEATLIDPQNTEKFKLLLRRLERIRRLTGAHSISLAGILPGHIFRSPDLPTPQSLSDPRPATQRALLSAIEQIIKSDFDGETPTIILFGGAGFVGADLAKSLRALGILPLISDIRPPGQTLETCLEQADGQPTLLIDVGRRGAIAPFTTLLWQGVVLLNETYPEPTGALRRDLQKVGVRIRHVAGIEGKMRPNLPGGYSGAVPCCAAHVLNGDIRAILKSLDQPVG